MAAAQLAPIAANVAEQVGGDALELTAGIGAQATAESTQAKKAAAARDSAMNSGDSCDQLEVQIPDVIELRRGAGGAPEYRELEISDSLAQRQWLPLADSETTPDGWRPAVNFLQMNFSPPLKGAIPEADSNYLAYAPAQSVSADDADRLAALTANFSATKGTFNWSGRDYRYAVTRTLPCFPPPPERSASNDAR